MCKTHKLYKGHYFIVFYDIEDKYLTHMFDNVKEILSFMKKEYNRQNTMYVDAMLSRALKRETHITRFLTGEPLRVYIIDTN